MLREYAWWTVLGYAVAVNVTIVVVRFAWFVLLEYVPWFGGEGQYSAPSIRRALVASWAGLRGAVSLAAALAIPALTASGAHVGHRNLVVFLTFSVILVTLVGGGLTLPSVVRALKIPPGGDEEAEEMKSALHAMSSAADATLRALLKEEQITADDARDAGSALRVGAPAARRPGRRRRAAPVRRGTPDASGGTHRARGAARRRRHRQHGAAAHRARARRRGRSDPAGR